MLLIIALHSTLHNYPVQNYIDQHIILYYRIHATCSEILMFMWFSKAQH